MALIACPEYFQQISNMASMCPHCGVGIASARETLAAGAPLTTIQETSKRLKLHKRTEFSRFLTGQKWQRIRVQPSGLFVKIEYATRQCLQGKFS